MASFLIKSVTLQFCVVCFMVQGQKRERIYKLRLEKDVAKAAEDLKKCNLLYVNVMYVPIWFEEFQVDLIFFLYVDDPNNDPNASGVLYKTLFVTRLVSCGFIFFCVE